MLIPIIILSIIAISIIAIVMRARGVRLAYIWLLLLIPGLIIWAILLFGRPTSIAAFRITDFYRYGDHSVDIIFSLTDFNKPLSFSVIALLLSYLFTSTIDPKGDQSLFQWIESILCGLIGWLVLLAGNTWSLLLTWTLMDVFQFVMYFRKQKKDMNRFIVHHIIKFLGSMLFVYITARTYQVDSNAFFGKSINNLGLLVLISTFLHSGVFFPILIEEEEWNKASRSLIFYLIPLSANLFVLPQVTNLEITPTLNIIIKIGFALLSISCAYKWIHGKNERENLNSLLISFVAITGNLFLSANTDGIIYLLVILLLSVNWVFLYSERYPVLFIFGVLAVILSSSFPFMIGNRINIAYLEDGAFIDLLSSLIPVTIVMWGIIKFSKKQKGRYASLENIVQGTYILGLAFPLISLILIISFMVQQASVNVNDFILAGLQLFILLIVYWLQKNKIGLGLLHSLDKIVVNSKNKLKEANHHIAAVSFSSVKSIFTFFVNIFEGDGGILWSIALLSLLLSILGTLGGVV